MGHHAAPPPGLPGVTYAAIWDAGRRVLYFAATEREYASSHMWGSVQKSNDWKAEVSTLITYTCPSSHISMYSPRLMELAN
jgi:hypothetical protein